MSSRDIDIDWDRVWDALDRLRNKQTTNWRDYITNEIMEADEVADIRAQWVASIKAVTGPTNFTLSNSEMGPLLNAAKLGAETFDKDMDVADPTIDDGGWDSLMDDIANARDEDKEVALRELADDILDALKRRGLA